MNGRERIVTAMSLREPDCVPRMDSISSPLVEELAAFLGIGPKPPEGGFHGQGMIWDRDLWCKVVRALDADGTLYYNPIMKPAGERLIKDDLGVVFRVVPHGEAVVAQGIISQASDLKGLDIIKTIKPETFEPMHYIIEHTGHDRAHFLVTVDPFRWSWQLRGGMDKFLADFVVNPSLVHALQRVSTDYWMAYVDMAMAQKLDIAGVWMGGDLADDRTTLMSPRHYRTYVQPYEKEVVACVHRHGLKFLKHSDGNLWPILDDLIDMGIDCLNPIQPDVMDICEVKKRVKGKICLHGNIDVREVLPFGSAEETVALVKKTIEVAAPGGGYVLGSSNSLMPGLKPENVVAMYQAARKYGVYPDLTRRIPAQESVKP